MFYSVQWQVDSLIKGDIMFILHIQIVGILKFGSFMHGLYYYE